MRINLVEIDQMHYSGDLFIGVDFLKAETYLEYLLIEEFFTNLLQIIRRTFVRFCMKSFTFLTG